MFHFGRNSLNMSSFVPTVLGGRRLIRYAPFRIFQWCTFDNPPVPLLRMLPVSLAGSDVLNRDGGAKSRFENAPDLRSACGLGIAGSSLNVDASGVAARLIGLKGRLPPNGESGRPSRRSLKFLAGAKSMADMIDSSFSI